MASTINKENFQRVELLFGSEVLEEIARTRVIIFGVGGVGSWCAECLVRSGIHRLTIVDSDNVCQSNCNRQLMATSETIGDVKVDALKVRLQKINPEVEITALQMTYNETTAESFHLEEYDYVIDAIDSLKDKAHLILQVTGMKRVTLFSSMGAALRVDPFKVRETEFWNVKGDALARALRDRFKKQQTFPKRKFHCVYSEEPAMRNKPMADAENASQPQANGSLCPVTGSFGFGLASLVLADIRKRVEQES